MYAKVFTQIYDSSIADDWQVRVVFEDFLILGFPDGVVDMTLEAISARTRVPIEIVTRAVIALQEPDPKSRTPDHEGRRLVLLDNHRTWGWFIVNYEKYKSIKREFDKRSYMRKFMQDKRERDRKTKTLTTSNGYLTSNSLSNSLSHSRDESVREGGVIDNDDAVIPTREEVFTVGGMISATRETCNKFFDHHQGNNLWVNQHGKLINWKHKLQTWRDKDREPKKGSSPDKNQIKENITAPRL